MAKQKEHVDEKKKVETFCKSALTKNHLPCIHM